jgi:dTDP-4-dehydrorhamnose reductase
MVKRMSMCIKMIHIIGKTGLIGRYVYNYLLKTGHQIRGYTRDDLNLLDLSKVREFIESLSERDWVINCAGIINKVNEKEEHYYIVNSVVPHMFDLACHRKGVYYMHPSTDCVFDDLDLVRDRPTAETVYGLSKTIGQTLHYSMVIRCSILGEEERGFLSYLEWVRRNKNGTVNGYINHTWNGLTCLEYAKFIERVISTMDTWVGIRTLRSTFKGAFSVTKYELTKDIGEIYELNLTVVPFETDKPNHKALQGELVQKDLHDQIIEQRGYKLT